MRAPLVRDVVEWRVEPTPFLRRAGQVLLGVGELGLSAMGQLGDWPFGSPRVPQGTEEFLQAGDVTIEGTAPWLGGPRWSAGPKVLQLNGTSAVLFVTEEARNIPLRSLSLVAARPLTRSSRPRQARATWSLLVSDGEHQLQIKGPWLALAWLGHLARWPEPSHE